MSTTYTASTSYICILKLKPNMVEAEGYMCPNCQLKKDNDGYCPQDGTKLKYGKYLVEDNEEQSDRGQEFIDDFDISKLYSKNDDIYSYHIEDNEYQIVFNAAKIHLGEGEENKEIHEDDLEKIKETVKTIRNLFENDPRFISLSEPKLYLVDHINFGEY